MPDNVRRGQPQGKCHRKQTAGFILARVKRCGKSAPRFRQRQRQGKPHREQNRIGVARSLRASGPFRSAARVGCVKRLATGVPDEWSSSCCRKAVMDRTRLTGRLAISPGNPLKRSGFDSNWKPFVKVDRGNVKATLTPCSPSFSAAHDLASQSYSRRRCCPHSGHAGRSAATVALVRR